MLAPNNGRVIWKLNVGKELNIINIIFVGCRDMLESNYSWGALRMMPSTSSTFFPHRVLSGGPLTLTNANSGDDTIFQKCLYPMVTKFYNVYTNSAGP